ncbi:MFS transporter [Umezawaea sp.]|uniref:MFS transporter n=1 Tax=Umezawaea sp. TaxID=1955258 RepID=UPI002ED562E6
MTEEDRAVTSRPPAPGPGGDAEPAPEMGFREVVSAGGGTTLVVIAGFQALDSVDNAMFGVFAPDVRESLGLTSSEITLVAALAGVMVAVGALPLGWLGDRRRRTTVAGLCALVWTAAIAFLGVVQSFWQLVTTRVVAGIGKASEGPVQVSILSDAYPPAGRGRVLGIHRGAQPLGIIAGPVLAGIFALLVPEGHEPWRWAFLFLAVPGLVVGLSALRLREPVRGHFEQEALLGGDPSPNPSATPVPLRVAFARLRKIRTFSFVMVALGAFGLCVATVPLYLSFILEDHFGQGVVARSGIAAVSAVGGLAGAALAGVHSDRLFRRSPKAALFLAGGALAALGVGFAFQAYSPSILAFTLIGMFTQAMTFGGLVPLSLVVASVTPPEFRATAFAVVGLYLAFVGGLGGALITDVAEQLWGARTAVAVVAPTASVLAGLVLAAGAGHLRGDIARAAADVVGQRRPA